MANPNPTPPPAPIPLERVQGQLIALRRACAVYGMPYNTVHRRVYRLGWTLEQAVLTPIQPVGKKVKHVLTPPK